MGHTLLENEINCNSVRQYYLVKKTRIRIKCYVNLGLSLLRNKITIYNITIYLQF